VKDPKINRLWPATRELLVWKLEMPEADNLSAKTHNPRFNSELIFAFIDFLVMESDIAI
jgi:hypothetical protein